MIRLEAKQASVTSVPEVAVPADLLSSLHFIPLSILIIPGNRPIILSQDQEVVSLLENSAELAGSLTEKTPFSYKGYRILPRSVTAYQPNRFSYDCLAVKISSPNSKSEKGSSNG